MSRKQKLRKQSPEGIAYLTGDVIRDGIDEESRSIPIVLATETPVETYDMERGEVVDEILKIDGMDVPQQVPLVDSHDVGSVRSVLGSIRDFDKQDGRLLARAYFASSDDAVKTFRDYAEGHLTDFSVRARRLKVRYEDNTRIVESSRVIEGSAVVAGADPNSKVLALRAYTDPHGLQEERTMDEFKALCIERGMPEDTDDVFAWAKDNLQRATEPAPEPAPAPAPAPKVVADLVDIDSVRTAERDRIKGITDVCRGIVPDDIRDKWIDEGITKEEAAMRALKEVSPVGDDPVGTGNAVRGGESQREKFYESVRNSFVARALQDSGAAPAQRVTDIERQQSAYNFTWKDQDGLRRTKQRIEEMDGRDVADEHRYVSLPDLARMFLEEAGERVYGLPRHEICQRAMRMDTFVTRASDGASYHTTGSFSNLMLDAANKTLLSAYDEANVSYPMWVRTAPDAPDFKTLNRIRFGELPDPEVVPENNPYPEKSPSDSNETYSVQKYGELFSISLEAVVNDDMNAISRIPQMQGNAMRRKINKVVYAILTDNAALSDGIALFHATNHGANLDGTALAAGAPLNVGFNVMMTQTGLSGTGTVLNLMPRYLIVPSNLAATALQITTQNIDAATVANTNLYGPGGPRALVTVVEAQLDASSTTGWYLAADSSQVDTVELTFLAGERAPVLAREEGFTTDTIKYKVRQTFNAKAIDFRGLYQGNS